MEPEVEPTAKAPPPTDAAWEALDEGGPPSTESGSCDSAGGEENGEALAEGAERASLAEAEGEEVACEGRAGLLLGAGRMWSIAGWSTGCRELSWWTIGSVLDSSSRVEDRRACASWRRVERVSATGPAWPPPAWRDGLADHIQSTCCPHQCLTPHPQPV